MRSLQHVAGKIEELEIDDEPGERGEGMRHVTIRMVARDDEGLESTLRSLLRPEVHDAEIIDD